MKHDHIIDHESYEQVVNAPREHLRKEIERLSATIFTGDNIMRFRDGFAYAGSSTYNFVIKPEAVKQMLDDLLKAINKS